MANWIARIKVTCPRGSRVARFIGPEADAALRKGITFQPAPGCRKGVIEMIQRGAGAGAPDRYEGERLEGARRRRKRARRRR